MIVTYKPEDDAEQRWEFDPKRVRASKAEMIEKRFGESWDMFLANIQQGSMRARRVLLWHLLTLEHPALRWEDTPDFFAAELLVEYSVAELTDLRNAAMTKMAASELREQLLTALDSEITEAMARDEAAGVEPEGKAPSSGDAKSTP